jgi:hypothetical protein
MDQSLIRVAIGLARTMDPVVQRRVNGLCNAYVLLAPLASAEQDANENSTPGDWTKLFRATQAKLRYFIESGNLPGSDVPAASTKAIYPTTRQPKRVSVQKRRTAGGGSPAHRRPSARRLK